MPMYLVKDGHTLGYVLETRPTNFVPVAGKPELGGHDWQEGDVVLRRKDKLAVATLGDFAAFGVRSEGRIA